jgi:hypothetical protein
MPLEEISNQLSFMSRQVLEDDMHLLPGRAQRHYFVQEGNEVVAGVARRGFFMHAAGLKSERTEPSSSAGIGNGPGYPDRVVCPHVLDLVASALDTNTGKTISYFHED